MTLARSFVMRHVSRALMLALGCAVIAGCSSGIDMRTGKSNDHEVAYRLGDRRDDNNVIYVERQPRVVYVQPVAPAYVYYPATPQYQTVPVLRTVPPTRYYYAD